MSETEKANPKWYADRLDKMTDRQLLSEIRDVMKASDRGPGADLRVLEILAEGLVRKGKSI